MANFPSSAAQRTTLVVDDDEFNLKLMVKQLSLCGITNTQAFLDPRAALALVKKDPYEVSLIVLDLQMPDLDGVGFIRQLGSIGYLGSLILVSGEDSKILKVTQQIAVNARLHVLGSLSKPTTSDQLMDLIGGRAITKDSFEESLNRGRKPYATDELTKAIGDYQLTNYYQPRVSLIDGRLLGFEALARWEHPRDGLVLPQAFIRIAEKAGLINELTRQMLNGPRGALSEARHWQDHGHKLVLSLNISDQLLANEEFVSTLLNQIKEARIPNERITVEVSDSDVNHRTDSFVAGLTRLRLNRVQLSLDDFGRGTSTLRQLADAPYTEMKLDMGFVRDSNNDKANSAILKSSLSLAKELGLQTVAEGIETRQEWDHLYRLGCDCAQGHFISRPMPSVEVLPWIDRWENRRHSFSEQLFDKNATKTFA
jgi:EAL domain-containing protein (putative c-di-GMP-specific phosphodiesterase class I)/FixJ family two-component response regulator